MSRATKALAALAALAAAASAAHPAAAQPAAAGAAPANCSRHIRVGVFDDANPLTAAFLTGWMDNAATACFSFYYMSTGNRAIERLANGDLEFAIVGSTPLTSAVARGVNLRSYQRVHVKGTSQGLVVKSGIDTPQDLRKKRIWVPITSTAHYIVLAALAEFDIDISSDITVEFKSPEEIREAWDAGTIDGAGCWGNTLTHLTSRPHGGTNETEPGHIIVDAATVARWGYITRNTLVTTREKLYELETDRIENGTAPNLVLETLKYFARANRRRLTPRMREVFPFIRHAVVQIG